MYFFCHWTDIGQGFTYIVELPQVNRHLERYIALLEDCKERDAVREMLAISRLGNQVISIS